jgi:hypothetical protein
MSGWSKNNFAGEVLKSKSEFSKGNTYHAEAAEDAEGNAVVSSPAFSALCVKSVFNCS